MRLLWAGAWADRLRLWSGLVLFAFALTHFLNHALGLWSLEAMGRAQAWRLAVTRSPPGTALLVFALLTHAGLAVWRLGRLRTFRLRRGEILQVVTGFAIPALLMRHLFDGGVAPRRLHLNIGYPDILGVIWPGDMAWQSLLLVMVWGHGCLGLHFWLRGESWYRRLSHAFAALAALVPVVALLGVVSAGRDAARLAEASLATGATGALTASVRAGLVEQARMASRMIYLVVALAAMIPVSRLWLFRVRRGSRSPTRTG